MISASLMEEVGGVMTGNDISSLGPVGGLSGELSAGKAAAEGLEGAGSAARSVSWLPVASLR